MLDTRRGIGTYTDDTEMMIGVAESLVECREFNGRDMSKRFVDLYNPGRGYGGGSYGNGSSMRIAPIGAFYCDDSIGLRKIAYDSSRITHAHPLGKEGAALQAFAVAKAINSDPTKELDKQSFILDLLQFISNEGNIYRTKLQHIKDLLAGTPAKAEIITKLGNDSSAPNSVPTAIYSFVSHYHDFENSVVYAVSLGGDTDTIGAMTGAISGGYYGKRGIPDRWLNVLENGERGRDYIENLAKKLWEIKINERNNYSSDSQLL